MGIKEWLADLGSRLGDWLDRAQEALLPSPAPEPVPVPVRPQDPRTDPRLDPRARRR